MSAPAKAAMLLLLMGAAGCSQEEAYWRDCPAGAEKEPLYWQAKARGPNKRPTYKIYVRPVESDSLPDTLKIAVKP